MVRILDKVFSSLHIHNPSEHYVRLVVFLVFVQDVLFFHLF